MNGGPSVEVPGLLAAMGLLAMTREWLWPHASGGATEETNTGEPQLQFFSLSSTSGEIQ